VAVEETEIWNGPLTANSLNYSSYFSDADFIYLKPSQGDDWSISGEFIEIDCDLLVTVAPDVKRRIPLGAGFVSTREVLLIPKEVADSGLLMELALQASFVVDIIVVACSNQIVLNPVPVP
jgi:hypothetical protein